MQESDPVTAVTSNPTRVLILVGLHQTQVLELTARFWPVPTLRLVPILCIQTICHKQSTRAVTDCCLTSCL